MFLLELVGRLIATLSGALRGQDIRALARWIVLYQVMSDDDLRDEFRRVSSSASPHAARRSLKGERALQGLAIACCLFDRHPCDLPANSKLYDEQKLAALSMLDGLVVQMDTGEGKTYAIAVAAIGMLVDHPQVIVVTANPFLAERDRARVAPFVEACGVQATTGVPEPGFRGITYTSISALCFGYLDRAYAAPRPDERHVDYPLGAAVVIDEIDSVLIDQTHGHQSVRAIGVDPSMWADVFDLVRDWDDDEYDYEPITDEITLKSTAWERVAAMSEALSIPVPQLLNLADGALWAMQAVEGKQYEIEDGHVLRIDAVTGQHVSISDGRTRALEFRVLREAPSLTVPVAAIDSIELLLRHPLVTGTSGTALQEAVYFLSTMRVFTVAVPPRFPRAQTTPRTMMSNSRARTLEYLARRILEVAPRPVVIGTWSPAEAFATAAYLRSHPEIDPGKVAVVSKFDSRTDEQALASAGESGRITVMSQGGSRGVDVRSEHNPLLIVLGHAAEPRLDRQFLGRVGRHGEGYEAEFVLDPESPIRFPALKFAAKLLGDVAPLPASGRRGLRTSQRHTWQLKFRRRQRQGQLDRTRGAIERATAATFARIRRLVDPAEMQTFVSEITEDLTRGATPATGQDDVATVRASIAAALAERAEKDSWITGFERTATEVMEAWFDDPDPVLVRSVEAGQAPDEVVELTNWVRTRLDAPEDPSGPERAMFATQVHQVTLERLPAPSGPRQRFPAEVVYESYLNANAEYLTNISRRLDVLAVSSSSDLYHRKASLAVRTLDGLRRLAAPKSAASYLIRVCSPETLDELYFTADRAADERAQCAIPGHRGPGCSTAPALGRLPRDDRREAGPPCGRLRRIVGGRGDALRRTDPPAPATGGQTDADRDRHVEPRFGAAAGRARPAVAPCLRDASCCPEGRRATRLRLPRLAARGRGNPRSRASGTPGSPRSEAVQGVPGHGAAARRCRAGAACAGGGARGARRGATKSGSAIRGDGRRAARLAVARPSGACAFQRALRGARRDPQPRTVGFRHRRRTDRLGSGDCAGRGALSRRSRIRC